MDFLRRKKIPTKMNFWRERKIIFGGKMDIPVNEKDFPVKKWISQETNGFPERKKISNKKMDFPKTNVFPKNQMDPPPPPLPAQPVVFSFSFAAVLIYYTSHV